MKGRRRKGQGGAEGENAMEIIPFRNVAPDANGWKIRPPYFLNGHVHPIIDRVDYKKECYPTEWPL